MTTAPGVRRTTRVRSWLSLGTGWAQAVPGPPGAVASRPRNTPALATRGTRCRVIAGSLPRGAWASGGREPPDGASGGREPPDPLASGGREPPDPFIRGLTPPARREVGPSPLRLAVA